MNKEEIEKHLLKAESKLESAKTNLAYSQYDDVVSRAYYSTFHAISAILLTKDLSFSSHSQTLGSFNKEFIKTTLLPKQYGRWAYKLFEFRETGDYDIDANIDESLANESISIATEILASIKKYIEENNTTSEL
jgi:uncharacterized protein (UPF0332 family)